MLFEEFSDVMFGTCLGCVSEEILVAAGPRRLFKLACKGDSQSLLIPSKEGWINHSNILGDLWILLVEL